MRANRFVVEIAMGNEAMKTIGDVAAALRAIARRVEERQGSGKVLDENGNSVGWFAYKLGKG